MKTFSKFQVATIKRTAQSVNPMVSRKNKIADQIAELQAEYNELALLQEQYEASIKTMTGGFSTEDLIEKVVEPSNSVDKSGKPIKVTKYVLKYPDTIIPPALDEIACTSQETAIDFEAEAPATEYTAGEESPIDVMVNDFDNNNN